jgi:hypothetical protein
MSSNALRQALGRAARELGVRAESTAAASSSKAVLNDLMPIRGDPILQPYYEKLTRLRVVPAASPKESSPSELEVRRCREP